MWVSTKFRERVMKLKGKLMEKGISEKNASAGRITEQIADNFDKIEERLLNNIEKIDIRIRFDGRRLL